MANVNIGTRIARVRQADTLKTLGALAAAPEASRRAGERIARHVQSAQSPSGRAMSAQRPEKEAKGNPLLVKKDSPVDRPDLRTSLHGGELGVSHGGPPRLAGAPPQRGIDVRAKKAGKRLSIRRKELSEAGRSEDIYKIRKREYIDGKGSVEDTTRFVGTLDKKERGGREVEAKLTETVDRAARQHGRESIRKKLEAIHKLKISTLPFSAQRSVPERRHQQTVSGMSK